MSLSRDSCSIQSPILRKLRIHSSSHTVVHERKINHWPGDIPQGLWHQRFLVGALARVGRHLCRGCALVVLEFCRKHILEVGVLYWRPGRGTFGFGELRGSEKGEEALGIPGMHQTMIRKKIKGVDTVLMG